ncbi:hypothetical protein BJX68DRAFT_229002 [Aspergillus pseudodeflectus]|uniref:Uncharacterized protein n=1 Tax=Aspergillus pseudodeflectus TaxID=176178 RepID=A0ABR4KZ22_9EURO
MWEQHNLLLKMYILPLPDRHKHTRHPDLRPSSPCRPHHRLSQRRSRPLHPLPPTKAKAP